MQDISCPEPFTIIYGPFKGYGENRNTFFPVQQGNIYPTLVRRIIVYYPISAFSQGSAVKPDRQDSPEKMRIWDNTL